MGGDNGSKSNSFVLPRHREWFMFVMGVTVSYIFFTTSTNANLVTTTLRSTTNGNGKETNPWKEMHIFYGTRDPFYDTIDTKYRIDESPKHKGSHDFSGQFGQDVAVAKFFQFKRNGFFVDLASNHAYLASNTFSLETNYGWNGICIEPNSLYWKQLTYRKCDLVAAFIGEKDMDPLTVTMSQDSGPAPYGGIVGKDFKNKHVSKKGQNYEYSVRLKTILKKFHAPSVIDFMSLDIEGAELFVMKHFPFDEYTFLTLAIENPNDELKQLLEKQGYVEVYRFKKGADVLFAHKSVAKVGKAGIDKNTNEIEEHRIVSSA